MEHAVDPEAELAAILERLEVDVAGPVPQGLLQDLIDHADDPSVGVRRGRGVEVEDVLILALIVLLFDVERLAPLADALGVLVPLVEEVELGLDDRQRRDNRVDPQPRHELELVHDAHLLGGDERDVENVLPDRHGADQPLHAQLFGEEPADLLGELAGFHIVADHRQEQILGINSGDLLIGDVAGADQHHLGQGRSLGLAERLLDLIELLRLEPATPGKQFHDQRLGGNASEGGGHDGSPVGVWGHIGALMRYQPRASSRP